MRIWLRPTGRFSVPVHTGFKYTSPFSNRAWIFKILPFFFFFFIIPFLRRNLSVIKNQRTNRSLRLVRYYLLSCIASKGDNDDDLREREGGSLSRKRAAHFVSSFATASFVEKRRNEPVIRDWSVETKYFQQRLDRWQTRYEIFLDTADLWP